MHASETRRARAEKTKTKKRRLGIVTDDRETFLFFPAYLSPLPQKSFGQATKQEGREYAAIARSPLTERPFHPSDTLRNVTSKCDAVSAPLPPLETPRWKEEKKAKEQTHERKNNDNEMHANYT